MIENLNTFRKKYLVEIILFVVCFILAFLYSSRLFFVGLDEIWNYGFSYNLSKGLVIYRDFNVLQTPLFFMIGSIFIKIFGNYLISLHVFLAIIIASIVVICYKMIGFKSLFIFIGLLLFPVPGYNLLSLFWFFLIIYFIHSKNDYDVLLGLIVSLLFLTKQNIGIVFFIPMLFYSKNKVKCFLSFCIPSLCLFLYLVCNNAVFDFLNCCFLGMLDFNDNNKFFSIFFLVIEIFSCLYLIFCLMRRKEQRNLITYVLMFQIMAYPICDIGHTIWAFIPVFFFICYSFKNKLVPFLIGTLLSFGFAITFIANLYGFQHFNSNVKSPYFLRNMGSQSELIDELDFVEKSYEKVNQIFYVSGDAYFFKLYLNKEINNYDFILNGNMGYHGTQKWINDVTNICNKETCVFFVLKEEYYEKEFTQLNMNIFDYVVKNYDLIDSDVRYYVYSNIKVI